MGSTRRLSAALASAAICFGGALPAVTTQGPVAAAADPVQSTVRSVGAYQSIRPTRANTALTVKPGRQRTFSFARVAGLPRSGIARVRATVTVRSAGRGSVSVRARASSANTSISYKSGKTRRVTVTLAPGNPAGWLVRNRGRRTASVAVVVTGYLLNPPPTPPSAPGEGGTPPARDIDTSPGPVSGTGRYDAGSFTGTDIWVDPVGGSDTRSGTTRATAVRTIAEAWGRVPANQTLSTGYRIQLVAGTYSAATMPNYWENRAGTYANPVILNAADGAHTARLLGDINMFNTRYFYLIGADIIRDADAFHCEQCSYTLIRNARLSGDENAGGSLAHETIKANQSDHLYIEDSTVSGADDNAIDFVAVQYGHLRGNRISAAQDWCAYAKGGSAYLTVAENEFFDCGTGGFTAGQGTGIEFMTSPWIYYEAMDIKVVNNIIHDTDGAGLGVNGGYNILMAYNTMYRVGQRSHLVEIVHGSHSCDGAPGDSAPCATRVNAGGWGTASTGEAFIPDKHVYFYNNVIFNPAGYSSQWQHFTIAGPVTQSAAFNVPNPASTDDDLRIAGNVIWNGGPSMSLGLGGDTGCQPSNPTCNQTQLLSNNWINSSQPDFVNAGGLDFVPATGGWLASQSAVPVPSFGWADKPAAGIPAGSTSNSVPTDRAGNDRAGWGRPGAY